MHATGSAYLFFFLILRQLTFFTDYELQSF